MKLTQLERSQQL